MAARSARGGLRDVSGDKRKLKRQEAVTGWTLAALWTVAERERHVECDPNEGGGKE